MKFITTYLLQELMISKNLIKTFILRIHFNLQLIYQNYGFLRNAGLI